jgi:hypothetical protein
MLAAPFGSGVAPFPGPEPATPKSRVARARVPDALLDVERRDFKQLVWLRFNAVSMEKFVRAGYALRFISTSVNSLGTTLRPARFRKGNNLAGRGSSSSTKRDR